MFENKNIIVGKSNHVFTNLYIDMLIHNCHIHPDNLGLITLDDEKNTCLPAEHDIFMTYYQDVELSDIACAKTITFISLNRSNSFLIHALLEYSEGLAEKIHVHLTDDELERWINTKQKHGKIIVTSRNSVGPHCLSVLPRIKHFIASDAAFRPLLKAVLGRDDFHITDARDAFSVMPCKLLEKFKALYADNTHHTLPEKKILIGPKRGVFQYREVIAFLRSMEKEGLLTDYKYMVFTYKKRIKFRLLLDLYCLYLRHIRKKIIDISFPTVTNTVTYNALLMSASHLIMQSRGSMSSTKEYIRMGRGIVHVRRGSFNHSELTQSFGIDVAGYDSFADLAANVKKNHIDIQSNQRIMSQRYQDSYARLASLYGGEVRNGDEAINDDKEIDGGEKPDKTSRK